MYLFIFLNIFVFYFLIRVISQRYLIVVCFVLPCNRLCGGLALPIWGAVLSPRDASSWRSEPVPLQDSSGAPVQMPLCFPAVLNLDKKQ